MRSAHKSEIELIKNDHEEKMVGAADMHRYEIETMKNEHEEKTARAAEMYRSEIDPLRSELKRMEKNIKSLESDLSYKEKERVRLENKVKFDQACTEKSHTKEIDTLEKHVKKEIEQRDQDILRLTNCQLSKKKVVNKVSPSSSNYIDLPLTLLSVHSYSIYRYSNTK